VVVVNKTDVAPAAEVLRQLTRAASLDLSEYFPVSAATGAGVEALVEHLVGRLPWARRCTPRASSPTSPRRSGWPSSCASSSSR
jgi:predicted GTPase